MSSFALHGLLASASFVSVLFCSPPSQADEGAAPVQAAVTAAVRAAVERKEIAGAVTLIASAEKILHLGAVGHANVAADRPMQTDTMFWIASMTKPVTACAILMLQDEGKLSVDDRVGKYLPELADLKTADGKPGNLTLKHLLTHTSGMAEASTARG